MGKLRTITRRSFMVGSAAVAGGVLLGTYEVVRPRPNPLHPPEGTVLNPWIIVDQRGVTVIVPRAEMGQGVMTTLAALAAEELEMPLETLRIEHGPPAQVYANEALLIGRNYDDVTPTGLADTLSRAVPRIFGLQITGGSSSTVDAFNKMRDAGGAAREVLKLAASHILRVNVSDITPAGGMMMAKDGRRLTYAELAEQAALLTVPKVPRLKKRKDWQVLGKSLIRVDQVPKATGTAIYGIDTVLPDMRFATVKISPRLGGEMTSFNPAPAETMPGVEKVISLGNGFAVVANNTWLAMQAAEAVEVSWGPAPYPDSTEGLFAQIEKAFDDKPNITPRELGDMSGEMPVSAKYKAPFLAHATMEPMNATALYTGEALEIWAGNQVPMMLQSQCAAAVDLKPEQVTVHTPFLGGGYGRRLVPDYAVLAAKVAREMPGIPVKTTWSREEDMRHDQYRPGALARMSARLENGRIAALSADLASPSVMRGMVRDVTGFDVTPPGDLMLTEGAGNQPYAIENLSVRGFAADLALPVGSWRSVGSSQNAFFWDSFIDELAHEAGADPLAFRLAHIRPEHAPSADVLEKVGEMSDWGNTPAGRARGVAFCHSFGTPVAEVVEVADEDGDIRITNVWIAADPGIALDPANVESQLFGGAIFGLSAALWGEITVEDGMIYEENFPDYELLRMHTVPRFIVELLESGDRPTGVGEPGTPPAAPALANALFALTGKRARELPLSKTFSFVS